MTLPGTLGYSALVALLVGGLMTPPDPHCCPERTLAQGGGDTDLYRAVAARVGHGEPYYPALGAEHVARGYPTGSVFNWRTPLYLELLGRAPWLLHGLLWLLGGLVVVGTAQRAPAGMAIPVALLQIGGVAAAWSGEASTFSEPLAGVLIALSVLAALRAWRAPSVLLGMAALFVRELVAPYVGIRLALALWRREWRDAIGWGVGLSLYALYFVWHRQQVIAAMPSDPTLHALPWVQGGGIQFVLATLTTNAWVLLLPWWVAPFALVGTVLGAWRAPLVVRLPVLGYLAIFAVVGLPFDWYWGWIPGMLVPLAWAHLPTAFPRRAAAQRPRVTPPALGVAGQDPARTARPN